MRYVPISVSRANSIDVFKLHFGSELKPLRLMGLA